jgi:hypothetical protein
MVGDLVVKLSLPKSGHVQASGQEASVMGVPRNQRPRILGPVGGGKGKASEPLSEYSPALYMSTVD